MAGFKDWTSTVLSSADVDSYLMAQCVIQCTSTTRPASPHEGMTVYETNTDRMAVYDGSNWYYIAWTSAAGRLAAQVSAPQAYASPVPTGSFTTVGWTVTDFDPAGLFAMGGGLTARMEAPLDGAYSMAVSIQWSSAWNRGNGGDFLRFTRVGLGAIADIACETNTGIWSAAWPLVEMTAGQEIEVGVLQSSGSGRVISSGTFAFRYLGR